MTQLIWLQYTVSFLYNLKLLGIRCDIASSNRYLILRLFHGSCQLLVLIINIKQRDLFHRVYVKNVLHLRFTTKLNCEKLITYEVKSKYFFLFNIEPVSNMLYQYKYTTIYSEKGLHTY